MGCAGCSDCDPSAFHLHITIKDLPADEAAYHALLAKYGMKHLVVSNVFLTTGEAFIELIPTLTFKGPAIDALLELDHIADELRAIGCNVLRQKVESSPDFWRAKSGYLEAHIKVPSTEESYQAAVDNQIVVSRIHSRKIGDEYPLIILTFRSHDKTPEDFKAEIIKRLEPFQLETRNIILEYALYDSNPDLDSAWIGQYNVDAGSST